MALSGYMFTAPTSILPYLEEPRVGPTSLIARALAQRLKCHVIAGYPEALPTAAVDTSNDDVVIPPTDKTGEGSSTPNPSAGENDAVEGDAGPSSMKDLGGEATGVGYNSAMVVAPNGDVVGNYRKTFRFQTDMNWAREGEGFKYFDLPEPLGRTVVGICMGELRLSHRLPQRVFTQMC